MSDKMSEVKLVGLHLRMFVRGDRVDRIEIPGDVLQFVAGLGIRNCDIEIVVLGDEDQSNG